MIHVIETHALGQGSRRDVLRALGGAALATGTVGTAGATQAQTHTLMVTANGPIEYRVSVDGLLEPDTEGGDFSADEDVAASLDGAAGETLTATTGPADVGGTTFVGDRFLLYESPISPTIRPRGETYVHVYVNGERVSGAMVSNIYGETEPYSLMIAANGPTEYEIQVPEFGMEADTEWGDFSADDDDAVTEGGGVLTAHDTTGPTAENADQHHFLGDRYLFAGTVEEFWVEANDETDVFVYVDERVTEPSRIRQNRF